jgi:hypothetical protein
MPNSELDPLPAVEPPADPEPPAFAGAALETEEPPSEEPEEDDEPSDGAGRLDSGPNSVATCPPEAGVTIEGLSREAA